MIAKFHLFMAGFWVVATAAVFLLHQEASVAIVLLYSAYANVYASIDGYHARKTQKEMEDQ